MSQIAAKVMISILAKMVTETFFAKVLIACLDSWAKQTENKLDDKVVDAMAEALGVSRDKLIV